MPPADTPQKGEGHGRTEGRGRREGGRGREHWHTASGRRRASALNTMSLGGSHLHGETRRQTRTRAHTRLTWHRHVWAANYCIPVDNMCRSVVSASTGCLFSALLYTYLLAYVASLQHCLLCGHNSRNCQTWLRWAGLYRWQKRTPPTGIAFRDGTGAWTSGIIEHHIMTNMGRRDGRKRRNDVEEDNALSYRAATILAVQLLLVPFPPDVARWTAKHSLIQLAMRGTCLLPSPDIYQPPRRWRTGGTFTQRRAQLATDAGKLYHCAAVEYLSASACHFLRRAHRRQNSSPARRRQASTRFHRRTSHGTLFIASFRLTLIPFILRLS